jgi:ribonucleoside-diphosphate reductase alpha chain
MIAARRRLPNRRRSETFELEHCGLKYMVTFSRFQDGSLGEAFISNHKRGNASDIAARDAGIILSFALQYDAPAEDVARALSKNSDGSASGLMVAVMDEITQAERAS